MGAAVALAPREPPAWVAEYIGQPYPVILGREAPIGCWLFVRQVLRERFGVVLPSFAAEVGPQAGDEAVAYVLQRESVAWEVVLGVGDLERQPRERSGDVVLFRARRYGSHIGVIVALRTMLHVEPGCTAQLSRIDALEYRHRFLGCYRHPSLSCRHHPLQAATTS